MREIDGMRSPSNYITKGKPAPASIKRAMLPVTEETPCSEILSFRILCAAAHCAAHQRLAGDAGGELDGEAVGNHKS